MDSALISEHIAKLAAAIYYLAAVVSAATAGILIGVAVLTIQTYRGK